MAHPESHAQYSGDISAGLDASKDAWGMMDQAGSVMNNSGMYLPDFNFNQQQLQELFIGSTLKNKFGLQQLGFWGDVKNFGRQVGDVGK